MRRVVITGMGVTSPIGNTVNDFEAGLFSGRNGIGIITRFDAEKFAVKLACEVRNLDTDSYLDPQLARKMDLFTVFAMVAAEQAGGIWYLGLSPGFSDSQPTSVRMTDAENAICKLTSVTSTHAICVSDIDHKLASDRQSFVMIPARRHPR